MSYRRRFKDVLLIHHINVLQKMTYRSLITRCLVDVL